MNQIRCLERIRKDSVRKAFYSQLKGLENNLLLTANENLFDGECEGITFEDVAPYIQKLYINKIKKRS